MYFLRLCHFTNNFLIIFREHIYTSNKYVM